MPLALIAGVVIVIIGAVGFVVTRDTTAPEELTGVEDALPVNDGPEPASEEPVDEGGLSADAAPAETLPAPNTDMDDPAVSGLNESDTTAETDVAQFVDGTYTVQTSYFTPRRTEHLMDVSLTLENNIVVDSEIEWDGDLEPKTPSHTGFDEAYEAAIIGQPLNEVYLSRVGGASLTSQAFNEAIEAIEIEASAS